MKEIVKMTGKVPENELEVLAGKEEVGGTGLGCGIGIAGITVAITLALAGCPTSTCTKSCIWMRG